MAINPDPKIRIPISESGFQFSNDHNFYKKIIFIYGLFQKYTGINAESFSKKITPTRVDHKNIQVQSRL